MKFNCPHCGQRLECQTLAAGMRISCPSCRNDLAVPSTPPPRAPEPAAPAPSPPAAPTIPHTTLAEFMTHILPPGGSEPATRDTTATSHVLAAQRGGEYALTQTVRLGGQGAILDAKDINLRRTVAMKVLQQPEQATQEQLIRFVEEAQITSQLEHPNIVPIHELGIDSRGSVFYTMKMVEGITLRDILNRIHNGDRETIQKYPLTSLLTILQKVCDAIAFAHSRHVVHRDLKPENIMVGEYGEVLVMDWGLAKVITREDTPIKRLRPHAIGGPRTARLGPGPTRTTRVESVRASSTSSSVHTMSGEIMGSPGYMAPEQARGDVNAIDERTDIYALGALLYNILTLEIPIKGNDINKVLDDIVRGNIRDPLAFNRRRRKPISEKDAARRKARGLPVEGLPHCPGGLIPESLAAVAMKAMALEPAARYPSVKGFQKDLEAHLHGFATSAEQASFLKLARLFMMRHRAASVAAAAVLLIVAAGSIINFQERIKAEQALQAFRSEQQERSKDRKLSAPEMVRSAKMLIEQDDISGAITALDTAIEYDPDLADARMLNTLLLLHRREIAAALTHAREARRLKSGDPDVEETLRICSSVAMKGAQTLPCAQLAAICNRQDIPTLAAHFMSVAGNQIQSYRAKLDKVWPGAGGQLTESREGTFTLTLANRKNVADLSRLKGIPIHHLSLRGTSVTDLGPLTGMPLLSLDVRATPIAILNLPANLPITRLSCGSDTPYATSPLNDIRPLKDLKIQNLTIGPCKLTDLSGLEGMPLTNLFIAAPIADLAPLQGAPIAQLEVSGSTASSLEPLRGMPLTRLDLRQLPATDLEPLRGMKITDLRLDLPKAMDLGPMQGMPLTRLTLTVPGLKSLAPLSGMPISEISISNGQFSDLEPLGGMPLRSLALSYVSLVADLAPLKGLPLENADFSYCYALRDIGPLNGLPLRRLRISNCPNVADLSALKGMKTLEVLDSNVPSPLCQVTAALTNNLQAAAVAAAQLVANYRDIPALEEDVRQAQLVIDRVIPLATMLTRNPLALPADAASDQGHHYWMIAPTFRCSWPEARAICELLGAHLVTVNSPAEQDWIARTFLAKSADSLWLGGAFSEASKTWTWTSGEPFNYKSWAAGQPDGRHPGNRCLAARPDGTGSNTHSSQRLPFLVEWDR